ncbi:MAG: NAD(P)H-binding protein [Gemmatimonadota bacterium]|jgi:uncharacterized protein YbjT (DUF2867 family)
MTEKILVTGATGKVGSVLVRRLRDAGREVKAGTRRPERAQELLGPGVEIVELDFERTETYDAAVQWADRVFLAPPPFDPRADAMLVPFLDWAVQSGSRHLVLLSAMGIEAVEHVALHRVEQRIQETGVAYTFLRPNWFMQNFASGLVADAIRERGAFELAAGAGRVSFVDVDDVADAAAVVLANDAHLGRAYTLTGAESLGFDDAARVLASAVGREVRYLPVSPDAMRTALQQAGWGDAHAGVYLELLASIARDERAAVSGDLTTLLGRPPRTLEAFAGDNREAWIAD